MVKLLTTINLGRLELLHRVVVLAAPKIGPEFLTAARHATRGGLVLRPFSTESAGAGIAPGGGPPVTPDWRGLNAEVRAHGGFTVAQLSAVTQAAAEALLGACVTSCRDTATRALAMQFDGVELKLPVAPLPTVPPEELVQAVIDVWGADRVGVRLAPFAWMSGPDDQSVGSRCQAMLGDLSDMEIAYVHVAGAVVPGRGDLFASPVGQRLRAAWPGILIASGGFTPATAIEAVERRWADLVGFPLFTGHGDELLAVIERTTR